MERARQFAKDCRDLGITIHGTFIVGLPGETTETIQETIRFAQEINPHTLQVSIAAPYPGTALYRQARSRAGCPPTTPTWSTSTASRSAVLSYPNLNRTEIFDSVDTFYRKFYFRAGKIAEISAEMIRDSDVMKRRLREGVEFVELPPQAEAVGLRAGWKRPAAIGSA